MLELVDVDKRYGSTVALDGMTFVARPGTVTGFLGPNGAGKSTSLRVLLGLDRPDRGRALVNGAPYGRLRTPLRTVGALLDARAVVPRRGAYPHLLALATSNGLPARRVREVLDLCGLGTVADRPAGQFSLGMSQRLGIAGALLGDPGVLILDEPVNGLDPEGVIWIRELLRTMAAEGRTVLLSSHLMGELALTAHDLVVVDRGRVIAQTTVADVVARARGTGVVVRSPDAARLAGLLRADGMPAEQDPDDATRLLVDVLSTDPVGLLAAGHAVPVLELTRRDASLEDAYLQLIRDAADGRGDATPDRAAP